MQDINTIFYLKDEIQSIYNIHERVKLIFSYRITNVHLNNSKKLDSVSISLAKSASYLNAVLRSRKYTINDFNTKLIAMQYVSRLLNASFKYSNIQTYIRYLSNIQRKLYLIMIKYGLSMLFLNNAIYLNDVLDIYLTCNC